MLERIRSKISLKPLIGISFFLTAVVIILICLIKWAAIRFEKFYISENEAYIKGEAAAFLSSLTREKAMRYNAELNSLAASATLIASSAAFFLDHSDIYGKSPINPNENLTVYSSNRIFSNDPLDLTMVLYWGGAEIKPDINKELNALSHTDPLIVKAQKNFPDCLSAYMITVSGTGRYFPNTHAVADFPPREDYDVRKEPFYTDAGPEKNSSRKPLWSAVYLDKEIKEPVTAVNAPIYSKRGDFRGIVGMNISLNGFLGKFHDTRESKSFSFLSDPEGRLIALLPEVLKLFGIRAGSVAGYSLSASSDQDIRALSRELIEKDQQVMHLSPGGQACLIAFHTIPATGWRLGLVRPESGILASVRETIEFLNPAVEKILIALTATALCLLLFSITMTVVFLIRRFGSTSESELHRKMSEDHQLIADELIDDELIDDELSEDELFNEYLEGDMREDELIAENRVQERSLIQTSVIEEHPPILLTDSYNRMVEALKKVNELEKEHSVELQKEIAERKRAEVEIRYLSTRILTGVEEGKKQLARDLHDEFGQTLAALHMNAETLQNSIPGEFGTQKAGISDLIGLIEQLGDKIRSISSNLRPDLLDDLGLVPTLEWYIKEFSDQKPDIKVDFQPIGFKKRRLSSELELVLYRVFQESMNNVVKHAKARTVDVTLTYSHPNVIFMIKDDGVGFDEETRGKDGIGLLGMRERIVSMKGQIDIRSTVGKGTAVRVEVPVN